MTKLNGYTLDRQGVNNLADAMKNKLDYSRRVKGRGGWDNCSNEYLSKLLAEQLDEDSNVALVDMANYIMMIYNNNGTMDDVANAIYNRMLKWKNT